MEIAQEEHNSITLKITATKDEWNDLLGAIKHGHQSMRYASAWGTSLYRAIKGHFPIDESD